MSPESHTDPILHVVNQPHQFSYENGIFLTELKPGYARGELVFGPNIINPNGDVHGGALATLADVVCGSCACSKGGTCVTANSTMEFLRRANTPKLYCEATPKKMGKTLSVIQFAITDDQNFTVATGTYTFFMFSK